MFTIVINMHVAFNNVLECSGVHTFKDRAELFAESEYVTEPEAVTEPRGILTQAKELSLEGDLASEIIAEQTDSTIDNAPKTFAAVNPTGGHETLATSTDNTGGAKNAGRTRKTCKARTTKKTRNARMNPEYVPISDLLFQQSTRYLLTQVYFHQADYLH